MRKRRRERGRKGRRQRERKGRQLPNGRVVQEKRAGDKVGRQRQEIDTERGAWGQGRGEYPPPQLHSRLEQMEPPLPPSGCPAGTSALASLSHPPPQQGLPARHPLLGVGVGPGSLGHLRQTGRVPGAMLLGDKAQGPSLSPEYLPGWGLALTWGLTWGPGPPRS